MTVAEGEIAQASLYDFVVVNENIDVCVNDIIRIIEGAGTTEG